MASANVDDVVSILSSPAVADALQRPELQNAIHKILSPSSEYITIWVLIATAVVATISALLIWLQLRADHERSRRELAIQLLRAWTVELAIETSSAVRLSRLFSIEQCTKLVARESFTLNRTKEIVELVLSCLEYRFTNIRNDAEFSSTSSNGILNITATHSAYIRFMTVRYLNLLEAIMAAWYEGVAKPSIIEGQFHFLRSSREADLKTLRNALESFHNVDPFPCITRFVANLQPRYGERPGLTDALSFRRTHT